MKTPTLYRSYSNSNLNGELYHGDALLFLKKIKNESADIIFLDPPFNLGKIYNDTDPNIDNRSVEEYKKWQKILLKECIRSLSPGGSLYLYHLPIWAMRLGPYLEKKLEFRHWITISMKNGFVRGNHLYPAHYALLYFTKGTPNIFNRPKLKPSKCRHCGDYVKDYGGYKAIIEQKGINLSDVWDDLSPVRHANRKLRGANQLPVILTDRIVQMSGGRKKLFVDPFAGTGTAVYSAVRAGMFFKACDIVKDNCRLVDQRINQIQDHED